MSFNKQTFLGDPFGRGRSYDSNTYKALYCPVEKAMFGKTAQEWVLICKNNGIPYEANDELIIKRWHANVLRELKKKAYRGEYVWLPNGEMQLKFLFYPHPKTP